jgi:hypothetical protein
VSGDLSPDKAQDVHPDLELLQGVANNLEAMARSQRTLLGQFGVSLPKALREQLLSNLNDTEAALPSWRQAIERLNGQWTAQKREQEELRALYATSQAINSTLDLATVLNTVMDHIGLVLRDQPDRCEQRGQGWPTGRHHQRPGRSALCDARERGGL